MKKLSDVIRLLFCNDSFDKKKLSDITHRRAEKILEVEGGL